MLQWLVRRKKSNQVAKNRLQQIMAPHRVETDEEPIGDSPNEDETPEQPTSYSHIEVNLLPPEYIPGRTFNFRNVSFLILSFMILTFLSLNAMRIVNREQVFDVQNQEMLQVLNRYRQLKGEIDALKERTALLHERRNLLANAIGQRKTWSDRLNQIYTQTPNGVWLSEVSMKVEKLTPSVTDASTAKSKKTPTSEEVQERIRVLISGDAKNLTNIAELMDRLEAVPFLHQTQLSWVNQAEQNDRPVMSFEINAQMRPEES